MTLEVRLIGSVEALVDGHSLSLGGRKQRSVVAMLALNANSTLSGDQLIDGLWGEHPPASAAKNLQLYVSRLRKALADGHAEAEIVTRGRGYELRLPEGAVDALRFEHLVEEAAREPASAAGSNGAASAALELWRGARSPTWPPSPSPPARSAGSRSCTCGRSSSRSTPSSPPGATTT